MRTPSAAEPGLKPWTCWKCFRPAQVAAGLLQSLCRSGQGKRRDDGGRLAPRDFILSENMNHSCSLLHYVLLQFISFWLLGGWLLFLASSRITKSRWDFVRFLLPFESITKFIITGHISPSAPFQHPHEVCGEAEEIHITPSSITPSCTFAPSCLVPTTAAHVSSRWHLISAISQSLAGCIWPACAIILIFRGKTLPRCVVLHLEGQEGALPVKCSYNAQGWTSTV